ncbi:MAG: hypothetical protein HFH72_08060 [Lachnospiraceae bacterium]|nr:hypothetical protein [Lachnospiraceae bacterium]
MRLIRRKMATAVIVMAMIIQLFMPVQKAEAAGVSSKSITMTLNRKRTYHSYWIQLSKKTFVSVDVKILQITGKAKLDDNNEIVWGGYGCEDGIGSYFYSLKPKDFVKGKMLRCEDEEWVGVYEKGGVTFALPNGVQKMKIRVTFKTKDGSKSLKSIKETKVRDYWAHYARKSTV